MASPTGRNTEDVYNRLLGRIERQEEQLAGAERGLARLEEQNRRLKAGCRPFWPAPPHRRPRVCRSGSSPETAPRAKAPRWTPRAGRR